MRKRYGTAAWCMAVLLMTGVTGCGGMSVKNMSGGSYEAAASETSADMAMPAAGQEAWEEEVYDDAGEAGAITSEEGIESVAQNGRKLIKTIRLEMQTKDFDTLTAGIRNKIQEMNGYIESSSVWGNSYTGSSTRSSDYTVRIPQDRLDEFIDVVSGLGNVTYKNESVEDVTLQYVDVESRQKALETEAPVGSA